MNTRRSIYHLLTGHLRDYAPDYAAIERLGAKVLPHLARIIAGSDLLLASKAAYAAARIGSSKALQVLQTAREHKDPGVRIAAAIGARSVAQRKGRYSARKPSREHRRCLCKVLSLLRKDADSGVRKVAGQAAERFKTSDARANPRKLPSKKAASPSRATKPIRNGENASAGPHPSRKTRRG